MRKINVGGTPAAGSLTVTGGTINNTIIGDTTPAAGNFTTLGATGAITGATSTNTINGLIINSGALSGVTGLNTPYAQALIVAKSGGDYTTIQGAIDAISDAATGKRYCVKVMPGTYSEAVTMKAYVDLEGSGWWNTIITQASGFTVKVATTSRISGFGIYITAAANAQGAIMAAANTLVNTTIENCYISAVRNSGTPSSILFGSTTGSFTDLYIRNNIIVSDANCRTVIIGEASSSIVGSNVFFENNRITGGDYAFIAFGGNAGATSYIVNLKNNYISGATAAIYAQNSAVGTLTANSFNNTYITSNISLYSSGGFTTVFNSYQDSATGVTKGGGGGTETFNGYDSTVNSNIITSGSLIGNGLNLPHVVNKAASANVRNSNNAEATSTSGTYVKVKTITLSKGLIGQQRFLFDLKTGSSPTAAYGKIYRNGVALGTEQSDTTGAYVTKSEDLTQDWNPGDTCELWIHGDGALTAYVRNFQIAYDDSPTVAVTSANS